VTRCLLHTLRAMNCKQEVVSRQISCSAEISVNTADAPVDWLVRAGHRRVVPATTRLINLPNSAIRHVIGSDGQQFARKVSYKSTASRSSASPLQAITQ